MQFIGSVSSPERDVAFGHRTFTESATDVAARYMSQSGSHPVSFASRQFFPEPGGGAVVRSRCPAAMNGLKRPTVTSQRSSRKSHTVALAAGVLSRLKVPPVTSTLVQQFALRSGQQVGGRSSQLQGP